MHQLMYESLLAHGSAGKSAMRWWEFFFWAEHDSRNPEL